MTNLHYKVPTIMMTFITTLISTIIAFLLQECIHATIIILLVGSFFAAYKMIYHLDAPAETPELATIRNAVQTDPFLLVELFNNHYIYNPAMRASQAALDLYLRTFLPSPDSASASSSSSSSTASSSSSSSSSSAAKND